MLDSTTKKHLSTQLNPDGVTYSKAKDIITDFITTTESTEKQKETSLLDRIWNHLAQWDQSAEEGNEHEEYDEGSDEDKITTFLDALKGNGKGKSIKDACWTCGKNGHMSRDCRSGKVGQIRYQV